ncbi:hypothetical protein KGA66_28760 [Actinocrinis puniceicyclus]|uniref:ApeA N-terminal domain-containing protein n=2 Tax=Actinocrinis puniceicyclus TaxID=977794 RepID=A0A8J8BHQ1_9ACTN|nr:hypothetical protein [Actinocrinis puniceicyclus]
MAVEAKGEWWLVGQPENKVSGTLRIEDSGRSELALIGTLHDLFSGATRTTASGGTTTVALTREALEQSGTYPRICGLSGSYSYTLEDCFRTDSSQSLGGGLATELIHVSRVFKGVWFEESEMAEAIAMVFAPAHLSYWVAREGGLFKSPLQVVQADDGAECGGELLQGWPEAGG